MSTCWNCKRRFRTLLAHRYLCSSNDGGCGKYFCGWCLNYSCINEKNSKELGNKAPISSYCKECFKINSSLDFNTSCTIFGPAMGEAPAILFLHGGGGCRTMFEHHAKQLAAQHYRCVLIDLPGHGALMDEPLTIDTACSTIQDALTNLCGSYLGMPPIAVGGSLGGYILMEFVGRFPTTTSGVVITMCGQNVGVNRSYVASLGLGALGLVSSVLSTKLLIAGLISEAKKNGHLDDSLVMESSLTAGMFFHQGSAQIAILKSSNPRLTLPLYKNPVLFINGSKDHRDSELIWKSLTEKGELLVYEDADHFLSHDKRFIKRFIDDISNFCQSVFNR